MASDFVHLHTHSEYSLLDGGNRIDALIKRAKELEMSALALTDHGVMYGCWEFYRQARKAGITPILGMEAYVAPGDRRDKQAKTLLNKNYYHLVLLAQNEVGYKNLIKLSSLGYLEGFYYNPRLDREILAKYSEGIVVTSACFQGEVAQNIHAGNLRAAKEAAEWYANVFDGRYYLEVQAHDTEGQAELNRAIISLADDLGLPLVATNDVHFMSPEDHGAHDTLICIGLGKDKDDPKRLTYDEGLYFKSASEMRERFQDRPELLENTLKIADETALVFDKKYFVPKFPLPEKVETEEELLRKLSYEGAKERYGDPLSNEVVERLEYELDVITKLGYSGYFLIVQDFINWAKENGIPVGPGRGSAAGSIVSYCLKITDLCPLKFDLLFERFLNPDRATMPDIDVDFEPEGRARVIDYVRQKYGEDAVGQIVTFGTMKARAVIRDVGRVLKFAPSEVDKIAKAIPSGPNSMTIEEAVEKIPEIAALANSENPRERELIENARRLEGLSRHSSIHAAGVVIAPGPLSDYIPVAVQQGKGKGDEPVVVSQYDMINLEDAGMLKMDFLGLKTLTVIQDSIDMVRERYGEHIDFNQIDLDDPSVYELLRAGRTAGVFQMESDLATDKLRAMRPDRFEDIVAASALIRPGPLDTGMTDRFIRRKRGEEEVEYPHPLLEEVLEPTLGVITYQEQVMRVAQILAGYTLAEADVLRKAVGKKDAELIAEQLDKFRAGAVANGVDPDVADSIASQIETFGRYGFNRSHSAAYGVVTFQTAWLKANFPHEFMAALLSSEIGDMDKVAQYLAEAREMGIAVLSPDVNTSSYKFNVVTHEDQPVIRVGLSAIRNVGSKLAKAIIAERESGGAYEDFFDFVDRAYALGMNRRALEALIGAGACDAFGHRAQLLEAVEVAIRHAKSNMSASRDQISLFDMMGDDSKAILADPDLVLPNVPEMDRLAALALEKEMVGFYVSGHPMAEYEAEAAVLRSHSIGNLRGGVEGKVTAVGIVTHVEQRVAKRSGNTYGKAVIEDLTGSLGLIVFSKQWARYGFQVKLGEPIVVEGRFGDTINEDENPDLIVDTVTPLGVALTDGRLAVHIRLKTGEGKESARIQEATKLFNKHPGAAPVMVAMGEGNYRPAKAKVRPSIVLVNKLRDIFGDEAVDLALMVGDRQRTYETERERQRGGYRVR